MKIRKISDSIGVEVLTDTGDKFGVIEEVNLSDNRVDGWRIRVHGGVTSLLGGARGVIIPHNFVRAVGDVFLISSGAIPGKVDSLVTTQSKEETY